MIDEETTTEKVAALLEPVFTWITVAAVVSVIATVGAHVVAAL